jgi:hypothetical protein
MVSRNPKQHASSNSFTRVHGKCLFQSARVWINQLRTCGRAKRPSVRPRKLKGPQVTSYSLVHGHIRPRNRQRNYP